MFQSAKNSIQAIGEKANEIKIANERIDELAQQQQKLKELMENLSKIAPNINKQSNISGNESQKMDTGKKEELNESAKNKELKDKEPNIEEPKEPLKDVAPKDKGSKEAPKDKEPKKEKDPKLNKEENKTLNDKIVQASGGGMGGWYNAMELFYGLYSSIPKGYGLNQAYKEQGKELPLEHVVYSLIGKFLKDKGYIKFNKASLNVESDLLKGLGINVNLGDEIEQLKDVEDKKEEILIQKYAMELAKKLPDLAKDANYRKSMDEAKKVLEKDEVKRVLASLSMDEFTEYKTVDDLLKKEKAENLYAAAIARVNGISAMKLKEMTDKDGLAKSIYALLSGK